MRNFFFFFSKLHLLHKLLKVSSKDQSYYLFSYCIALFYVNKQKNLGFFVFKPLLMGDRYFMKSFLFIMASTLACVVVREVWSKVQRISSNHESAFWCFFFMLQCETDGVVETQLFRNNSVPIQWHLLLLLEYNSSLPILH